MKILFSWGHHGFARYQIEKNIQGYIENGYDITPINHRDVLGEDKTYSREELYNLYQNKDPRLLKLYEKIRKLSKTHDVFIVKYDNVYIPEFLKSLTNIYKVYFCDDDPEGSDVRSKPYVHAFDHNFAAAVNFDKTTKTWEKYLEWGARRAEWYPIGVLPEDYSKKLSVNDIVNNNRENDVVFVGNPWLKFKRLAEIKKGIPQIKIYGRGFNLKKFLFEKGGFFALVNKLGRVKELPMSDLVPLYLNTKIGLNIHLSHGPINKRLFQLPANGVMQICDCPEGLGDVFEIDKEVVAFHTIEEAIELIRYYLEHDDERRKIAVAGFKRVMKDYKDITIFDQVIEKIKKGMLEDRIKQFKNGGVITV